MQATGFTEKSPEVSVKLVLCVGGHVLILKRPDGSYTFPGGHVEWGESSIECLRRELREELSYDLVQEPEFADLYEYISPDHSQHIIILHYVLYLPDKPAFTLGDDEADSEATWLTQAQLQEIVPRRAFIRNVFK